MIQIREFKETYPHWSLSFRANNPMTATEKLFGMRMSNLLFHNNGKTYQEFPISKDMKDMLLSKCNDGRAHCFEGGGFNVIIKVVDNAILGICKETRERVCFDIPFTIVIPGEHGFSDEHDTEYSQYRGRQQEDLYK